jgi:hypothetical protein
MHWDAAQANGGAEPAGSEASAPALHASAPEMPTLNQIQDEGAARNEPAKAPLPCLPVPCCFLVLSRKVFFASHPP